MNQVLIITHTLTDHDFNPELIADLIAGVLRSVKLDVIQVEITKVADAVILKRRAPKQKKTL